MPNNIEPKDVIKVVEATINFLEINLCEENLSPSTEMERLETVERLNLLVSNLRKVEKFGSNDDLTSPSSASKTNSLEKSQTHGIQQELNTIFTPSQPLPPKPEQKISPLVEQTVSKLKILTKCSIPELKKCADHSGVLLKYKKQLISKWNKRFCVLRDGILLYFQSETDLKGKGFIVLGGYKLVVPSNSTGYTFNLVSLEGSTVYSFQADQKKDTAIWLEHLTKATEKGLKESDLAKITSLMKDGGESVDNDGTDITKANNDRFSKSSLESDSIEVEPSMNYEDVGTYCPPPTTDYDDFEMPSSNFSKPPATHVTPNEEIYEDTLPPTYEYGDIAPPNTLPVSIPICVEEEIYDDIAEPDSIARNDTDELYGDVVDNVDVSDKRIIEESIYEDIPSIINKSGVQLNNSIKKGLPPLPLLPKKATFSKENIYIAAYDCVSNDLQDLSFKCGDVLYVTEMIDQHWWIAVLNGKAGLVPSNFLRRGLAIASH